MAVYLVRHAAALSRSEWQRADEIRPLSKKGERQADALVDLLAAADVRRILSSPATRCLQTVAPAAAKLGLEITDAIELLEDGSAKRALELVVSTAEKSGDSVLCSHGDLIPEILRRLVNDGMELRDALQFAKGSTWHLDGRHGRLTWARYYPPVD